MASSVVKLAAIASSSDITNFKVPLVYVKGKTILTLNSANRMLFPQRVAVKNKYKKIIEPMISKLPRFKTGHLHLVFQVMFSDRRFRDVDNQIFLTKYIQDSLVENKKLDDDKFISFTFLPAINEPKNDEHYCEVTCIELGSNNYFNKIKDK